MSVFLVILNTVHKFVNFNPQLYEFHIEHQLSIENSDVEETYKKMEKKYIYIYYINIYTYINIQEGKNIT